MLSRSDLGHHTAVFGMRLDLTREQMNLHRAVAIQHRNGGLVARGFDSQCPQHFTSDSHIDPKQKARWQKQRVKG